MFHISTMFSYYPMTKILNVTFYAIKVATICNKTSALQYNYQRKRSENPAGNEFKERVGVR